MTGQGWRIVKAARASDAFSGDGAAKYGGRWNSRGRQMVYASASQALAALELLVHLNPPVLLSFVVFPIEWDADLVEALPETNLPQDWRLHPPPVSTQRLGDDWLERHAKPILSVPSVLIPEERNFLLNPTHPQFRQVRIGPARPFSLDPRLLR